MERKSFTVIFRKDTSVRTKHCPDSTLCGLFSKWETWKTTKLTPYKYDDGCLVATIYPVSKCSCEPHYL